MDARRRERTPTEVNLKPAHHHERDLYTSGAKHNIREFHQFITEGEYDNPTVAPSVRSNLTAILGRESGYRKGEVTLADLIKQGERLRPNLTGLKS